MASVAVRGCRALVFRRHFRHCLRLGGRLYASGDGNVQNISKAERRRVTIAGEPVAEVDLVASFLAIFLALTGTQQLPEGDLYAISPDIPRAVSKAFFTQSFGAGKLMTQWADNASREARQLKVRTIREAALQTYPTLASLSAILPADIVTTLPTGRIGWAVGQFLAFVESEIVTAAISSLRHQGVLALPVHDSIIVAETAVEQAQTALVEAFKARLGIEPRFKVNSETHGDTPVATELDEER